MTSPGNNLLHSSHRSLLPALIIFVYLGLGVLYTIFVPPFEGPDEPQHYAYVAWLIRTNSLPPAGDLAHEARIEHEASQHPFYYVLASLPGRLVDIDDPPLVYRPNPHFIGPLARDFPDNDNRAIHYEGDGQPLAGGWLAFYMARGVTLLFGALLIAAVYGLGRQMWPDHPLFAVQSAALTAVIPQILFLGAVISNDVPVAALGACTMWALASLLRQGYSAARALILGIAYGLATLTKVSALALAAPLALGLLWLKWRRQQSWAQFARMGLLVGGAALFVCGWWFVRSWMLYGSPFGLETHAATTWAIVDAADVELARRRWWEVFRSFWLWFGWGTVRAADSFYYMMGALALLALAGLGRKAWQWVRERRWQQSAPLTTGPVLLALSAVALLAEVLLLEGWMRQVIAPFGRLLYPALGAIIVLLVAGWRMLHSKLPFVITAFLLVVALLSPWLVLQPAYERPQRLPASEVDLLGSGIGLRFGASYDESFAELVSLEVLEKSVPAGEVAPVRVCWRALQQAQQDYSLLLQIIGPQDRRIAGRSTYPGLGAYPTSQWHPGDLFCDLVQIEIGSEPAVEPLVYQLEVAMIDSQRNRRLPIFDAQGARWPVAFVDRIRVYSAALVEVSPSALLDENETLQLIDYTVSQRTWRPQETVEFMLQWATTVPQPADYQTFVHLRAPDVLEPVAQSDGPPLDGWYPTSWWPVGEIVRDERQFLLPADTPPGVYHLYVGMYDLSSNRRVSAEYDLGSIVVEP